jgi:PAS domain S-box-containing protein
MRLRLILLVLSLLAFLSASIGGYLYYTALREAAFKMADRRAFTRVEMLRKNLSAFLLENIKPVQALAGIDELREMLIRPGDHSLPRANAILDIFKNALKADVCYLMNHEGTTVASSNRDAPDSFIGKNFAFRPYFQLAIHRAPATYLALGTTSGKRGAYYSFPIFEKGGDVPIGLAVIKASIEEIENKLDLNPEEIVLVTGTRGIVFISNRKAWLYRSIRELTDQDRSELARSRQFGQGPWPWIGLDFLSTNLVRDRSGTDYQVHRSAIAPETHPGWDIIYLQRLEAISKSVSAPLIQITGPIVLSLCILIGLSVFLLYREASREIRKRMEVEKALRESDARYRSLYHNTPAMLHSIDPEGRLISVSGHWAEALGYPLEEVIGKHLTDFLTEDSGDHAQEQIFPEFFKTGVCKDVPYQFVKKNGDILDILLSAIADRDHRGRIKRSLAVSIDVTERKRAEEALKLAKEELSQYSKNLERQVEKRTREITGILANTPDVVYIKDREGRYVLINARYEAILGLKNDAVRGKTDYEILPREIAERVRRNDQQVIDADRPFQFEEQVPQKGTIHTFLSVKFPIYDRSGQPNSVCSISTDITDLKKAQDQLRRLSGSVIASQEKERAAIARELHDELGQVLTALRMDAVWLAERLREGDRRGAERARAMCDLIDKNIEDVRGMAMRLRPGVLDDLGLVDALEWYTSEFERRMGIACVFEHGEVPVISDRLATASYRIAQEALTNVARHADAGHVQVTLRVVDSRLSLTVFDDGRGFDPEALGESEGLGVAGMIERASLTGGRLVVRSTPGKGTEVRFKMPLTL